ncbi:phage minor tail protein L [Enterobacter hormaechei]|uniref:phage minor tail protein L n=1 Tax=Enterobacter hormaechei TaxID=158836 RepID=UPI001239491A|nr:phage minor tail protein L [Enterobacter hormaechei]QEU15163.1 phage minor tail protein L [Enterobacter hormaechei]
MGIAADDQKLQPGNQITLFEVDGTAFGADVLYFHNHAVPYTEAEIIDAGDDESKLPGKPIYWQGIRYELWPCQIEDIEANGDGTPVSPKLSVGNLDGSISALCHLFQDMKQAKVTIHRTYAHYLDASNFPDGNPQADPTAEQLEVFYIDSKTADNETDVQFKLSSPVDVTGQKVPGRQMTSRCAWCLQGQYRGADCGYTGTKYFDKFGNPVDNPADDVCSGTVAGCKLRWGEDEQLPFGGFPAIAITRI